MIRIAVEPTARGPTRQPKIAGNGAAPLLADASVCPLAMPRHWPLLLVGTPSAAEPPLRAISRLAASCGRSGSVTAVTTLRALMLNLPGTATADIGACLHDLCRDLAVCFARPNAPRLSCSTAAHHLPTGTVLTLGLIADLLLTNAYSFGFVPPAGGRIAVAFSAFEASFELTIEDSGVVHLGTARRRADKVKIARRLVRELGGWLETPRVVGGSRCIVIVPRAQVSSVAPIEISMAGRATG